MEFEYSSGIIVYSYIKGRRAFLFLKRREGWLDIPKGHIERGERARDAAIRETFEEAGLRVEPDRFFKRKSTYWFRREGKTIKKTLTVLLARAGSGARVRISSEHVGYVWLELGEAMRRISFEDSKEAVRAANEYIDRMERMDRLNAAYRKLPSMIKGWALSRGLVPGEGPLDAKVMLVGQAPGRHEDMQGRPFVGLSGRLLDRLIKSAGLKRDRIYITSVVQFFPPKNRAPSWQEVEACRKFLKRQIEIIDPKIVVLAGAVAAGELLEDKRVMKSHGNLVDKERYYFTTIHPAAAVRLKKNLPLIESDFARLRVELKKLGI